LDTRSAGEVKEVPNAHARTGCVPHSSYWPARLLWLHRNRAREFAATRRWISFPEYLFQKLFGRAYVSTSMVSGSGLWNQNANDYDAGTLAALPISRCQLAPPEDIDRVARDLLPEHREAWPAFADAPWFPALGDGACDNLGSGCIGPDRWALMVGTTGAMRVVIEAPRVEIPGGLWCYRVDRKRFVMGAALSNGGEVFAWMKRTLQLPKDLEARLDTSVPGDHGLTLLPFFSGERSPYWRADLRAAITGLSLSSEPFDILRAALESVALRFRDIQRIFLKHLSPPAEVVSSGGALERSPGWTRMMADALGRPVTVCLEQEASSRGAALWALEQIGAIGNLADLPASMGGVIDPRPANEAIYERLLNEQHALYEKLFGNHT
jgi:gluconokinase